MEFKRVNISTYKGLKEAEKLKEEGWIVQEAGTETIMFSRGKSNKYD